MFNQPKEGRLPDQQAQFHPNSAQVRGINWKGTSMFNQPKEGHLPDQQVQLHPNSAQIRGITWQRTPMFNQPKERMPPARSTGPTSSKLGTGTRNYLAKNFHV